MIPGLWGQGTVSFESSLEPGFYLRARGDTMWVEQGDMGDQFRRECSFNARDDRDKNGIII